MVLTSLIVPLVPAGTVRHLERQNQLNVGLRKTFRAHGVEWAGELDLFNALNTDTILTERSANFGTATYGIPSRILPGRIPRLAVRMKW